MSSLPLLIRSGLLPCGQAVNTRRSGLVAWLTADCEVLTDEQHTLRGLRIKRGLKCDLEYRAARWEIGAEPELLFLDGHTSILFGDKGPQ